MLKKIDFKNKKLDFKQYNSIMGKRMLFHRRFSHCTLREFSKKKKWKKRNKL